LELDSDAKVRYKEKIDLVDPYCRLEGNANCFHSSHFSTVEWYKWPAVIYVDVYNFLINTTSYTVLMSSSSHTEVWRHYQWLPT